MGLTKLSTGLQSLRYGLGTVLGSAAPWTPANGSPFLVIDPLATGGAFTDAGTTPAVVGDAVYQVATNLYGSSIGSGNPAVQATLASRPILRADGLEFPLAANTGVMDFTSTVGLVSEPYTLYAVGVRPAAGTTFIPWGARDLSLVSAPRAGGLYYNSTNTLFTMAGPALSTGSRTESGLICMRWRRSSSGGNSRVKVTGVAEWTGGTTNPPCFQTIGARVRATAIYNDNSANRYRGWILLKYDAVEVGNSALWESWIAANWGVAP